MDRPSDLPNGTTARVHVDWLMGAIEDTTHVAFGQIRSGQKLRPKTREHLGRELAGAIGKLEGIRLWLDAGAPE